MTKNTIQRAADSDLKAFMTEAADRFKPDAAVLAARIDTAVQRYEVTSTTQRFNAPAPLAMQQLQEWILEGWRYDIGIPQSVYVAGTGNMSITLRKPAELVEQEIADLKRQVEEGYHNELAAAMEREVDKLVQDAANEAQRRAEEAAASELDDMRQRLRDMLLAGATA
ncbi:TPA: hypothetical protein ND549_000998 [Klebsiella michiganensis]|uniref:hypothetical protein n=1 Tax=Klebsiella michiganensis TaxID=1134687 RepID=UPI000FF8E996|nr:hypothetical protein [Klebsiella michiganensis]QAS66029.1 hypothetical protein KOCBH_03542 [Klebsiella michiganensis]HCD5319757.1 hypothetical protein [Klebsiella michiganensis]HCD7243014.1 hypothetical protein [Klebsiella michiganensis]HCD7465802.1 hypothetical protein [Klebsiella michiganensis]HCD7469165.1 hypothetical protein [Klebsiella michiganensis]